VAAAALIAINSNAERRLMYGNRDSGMIAPLMSSDSRTPDPYPNFSRASDSHVILIVAILPQGLARPAGLEPPAEKAGALSN
jgi:hypothetical protein